MADWTVNLPDVTSCKLSNQTVANIYDKVGDRYRLLWPHPGTVITKDISTENRIHFNWDSIDLEISQTSVTGSATLGITTMFSSNQVAVSGLTAPNWFCSDDTIYDGGTYSCSVEYADGIGYSFNTDPISEVGANDFSSTSITLSKHANPLYVSVSGDFTYTGTDYTYYLGSHDSLGLKCTIPNVTVTYYDGMNYYSETGDIPLTDYTRYIGSSWAGLHNGSGYSSNAMLVAVSDIPGMSTYGFDQLVSTSIITGGIVCTGCQVFLGNSYTITGSINGSLTIPAGKVFDSSETLLYTLESSIPTGSAVSSITLSESTIPISNPNGKRVYTVSPSTGELYVSVAADPGYALKVTAEDYTCGISFNGSSYSINTTNTDPIIFAAGSTIGQSVARTGDDYTCTTLTLESTDASIAAPSLTHVTTNTLTVLTYIDNI